MTIVLRKRCLLARSERGTDSAHEQRSSQHSRSQRSSPAHSLFSQQ